MALLPNFTAAGDANPIFSDVAPLGGRLVNLQHQYNQARPPLVRKYSTEQEWTRDTSLVRYGSSSVRVTSYFDGYGEFGTASMGMIVYLDETKIRAALITEGDEEWVGFSMYFPGVYNGTNVWALCEPFASVHHTMYPAYGYGFTTPDSSHFRFDLKTGLRKGPGTGGGDPITSDANIPRGPGFPYAPAHANGFDLSQILLGSPGMPPFTKNKWHDLYYHAVYQARTDGVLEIWHREEGATSFTKLYSNLNDGSALVNHAPHPTWFFNAVNGTPDQGGVAATKSMYRIYRPSGPSQEDHNVQYWVAPWFRCQNEAQVLAVFPSVGAPSAPTISGFSPSSGGWGDSVVITGTNLTAASSVTFNGLSALIYTVNSPTQITAIIPQGASTGKIGVTTSGGSVLSASDLTVNPPIPTIPHLGSWSIPAQINAAALPPPIDIPPPDPLAQHLGSWSVPARINASGLGNVVNNYPNTAAAVADGWQLLQMEASGGFISVFVKTLKGDPGRQSFLASIPNSSGVSQAIANSLALESLNRFRQHYYGGSPGRAAGSSTSFGNDPSTLRDTSN